MDDKEHIKQLTKGFLDAITGGLIPAPGVAGPIAKSYFDRLSTTLRDEWIWQFPLLPAAISTYVQTASTREWTITGDPRRASRAVEKLNNAAYIDSSGVLHVGWQEFEQRRILDWLCFGKTAFLMPMIYTNSRGVLQYVSPDEVRINRSRISGPERIIRSKTPKPPPDGVKPFEYAELYWGYDELFINHLYPVGPSGVTIGPLFSLLPSLRLLWLIREHDMAAVDGRKIRDIFLVADDNMRNALVEGATAAVQLWNGGDPQKIGTPIVAANILGASEMNMPMEDFVHRIGIADMPDTLERDKYYAMVANEISGVLGIALRSWYENLEGTNRSLERVNAERARVKGPAYFNRAEMRFINNSGVLGRVHFDMLEETDIYITKEFAETAKTWAEAIVQFRTALGDVLPGRAFVELLQRNNIIPDDAQLVEEIVTYSEQPVTPQDMVDGDLEDMMPDPEPFPPPQPGTDQQQVERLFLHFAERMMLERIGPFPTRYTPQKGEVVLNREGQVIDYRRASFHVAQAIGALNDDPEVPDTADLDKLADDWDTILKDVENGTDETVQQDA